MRASEIILPEGDKLRKLTSRFEAKINKDGPIHPSKPEFGKCWNWTACKTKAGYGQINLAGLAFYAHRVSWLMAGNKITEGRELLHSCDNPACVNPQHLSENTHHANMLDAKAKGRTTQGTKNSQVKLTESQVYEIRALCVEGKIFKNKIAEMYGVTDMVVGMIHRRQRWAHLPD